MPHAVVRPQNRKFWFFSFGLVDIRPRRHVWGIHLLTTSLSLHFFWSPKKSWEKLYFFTDLRRWLDIKKYCTMNFERYFHFFSNTEAGSKSKGWNIYSHPPALIPMSKTAWSRHQIFFLLFFLLRPSTASLSCKSALVRNTSKNWGNSVSSTAFWDNLNLAQCINVKKVNSTLNFIYLVQDLALPLSETF